MPVTVSSSPSPRREPGGWRRVGMLRGGSGEGERGESSEGKQGEWRWRWGECGHCGVPLTALCWNWNSMGIIVNIGGKF
jgi:hypothetical protein